LFGSLEQESNFFTLDILWLHNNFELLQFAKEKNTFVLRQFDVWEEVDLRKEPFNFQMKKYN